MKKQGLFAAALLLAAALAGCALKKSFPAFLPPGGGLPQASAATAQPTPEASSSAPVPSPTPVPTPSPAPTPKPYDAVRRHHTVIPSGLAAKLAYDRYSTPLDYFVALKSGKVYEKASSGSRKLLSFSFGNRFRTDKTVLGEDGKGHWVHVLWSDRKGSHEGYVEPSAGLVRGFRLGSMLQRAEALRQAADQDGTVFVSNYKNAKGLPPALPGGGTVDRSGNRRSQSAPAYSKPDANSSFRYAPDGLLGRRLQVSGGYTQVWFPTFGEARWVPTKYLSKQQDAISALRQVVVVDRLNQNAAVFEHGAAGAGGWTLKAMTFVSTGKPGQYSLKTPLGDFMAQGRYPKFYYYADGTQWIEGYAPWAIRFSGGGYLHGVPRKCDYDEYGNRWDPEPAEALHNLGTTPQSHMCVRNYTSFAKFVYDWYKKGQCAVIVME